MRPTTAYPVQNLELQRFGNRVGVYAFVLVTDRYPPFGFSS